jgi:hypothetical protein
MSVSLRVKGWASAGTIDVPADTIGALHPDIPGGFVGTFWLGGVAMFGLAGFHHTPPTWLVGFMVCLAWACVWAGSRWLHSRLPYREHRMAEAVRARR